MNIGQYVTIVVVMVVVEIMVVVSTATAIIAAVTVESSLVVGSETSVVLIFPGVHPGNTARFWSSSGKGDGVFGGR